jgi:hypothetical protein
MGADGHRASGFPNLIRDIRVIRGAFQRPGGQPSPPLSGRSTVPQLTDNRQPITVRARRAPLLPKKRLEILFFCRQFGNEPVFWGK